MFYFPSLPALRSINKDIFLLWLTFLFVTQTLLWKATTDLNKSTQTTNDYQNGGIEYILRSPPEQKMDEVDKLSPSYPSSFVSSLKDSFKRLSNVPLHRDLGEFPQQETTAPDDIYLQEAVDDLVLLMTRKKITCKKLVRVGGRSCRKKSEGAKNICLDAEVEPKQYECIGYSFGVGHDFTFDTALVSYGCETFAFDSDKYHQNYSSHPAYGLTFIKIRLGYARFVQMLAGKEGVDRIVYRPLHDIMQQLNHQNISLDILKMDVENSEWEIFQNSIFKTKILEKTKQLSLELHMEEFNEPKVMNDTKKIFEAVLRYTRTLKELEKRGFLLAHYEPNYFAPKVINITGRTFHIYCETLWLNPNYKNHEEEDFLGNLYDDYEYPPKELVKESLKYKHEQPA